MKARPYYKVLVASFKFTVTKMKAVYPSTVSIAAYVRTLLHFTAMFGLVVLSKEA